MKNKFAAACALILALVACSRQPSPTPTRTVVPPTLPTVEPRRAAVVIAWGGARPDWITKHMTNGTMPNLSALAQRGVNAEYLQPIDPTLSTPAYLALSTGEFTEETGLASSTLQPLSSALSATAGLVPGTANAPEPIWRTAMRKGLKTATLFWPVASPDELGMGADYMLVTTASDVPSAQHVIPLQEASGWEGPSFLFSAPLEGTLRITSREGATVATLHVLAIDDTGDITPTYSLLLLDDDKDLTNGYTELGLGKCAAVTVSPRLHSAAHLCFTASQGLTVTLYQGQPWYNRGRPADLLRAVNEQFGSPPPEPDSEALYAGWLSPEQYFEMAAVRSRWMRQVVAYVYQTYTPDLLLAADDIIAACARAFLLVDGRQEGYSPEKADSYSARLQQAHAVADDNLKGLLTLINLADTAVFVVSTHGVMPVHTTVHLNTILSNAKLLQVKAGTEPKQIDVNKSKAWAMASGGSAYVYINLQGRERVGIVAPEDYAEVQDQIIQALEETRDDTEQPVFARILKAEELDTLHLQSPNAGDVLVQAASGYLLSAELGSKEVLVPTPCCAADGFAATSPEMRGVFIAAGMGLASGKEISPTSILDLAPTVAQALRVQPPATIQGRAVEGIWR